MNNIQLIEHLKGASHEELARIWRFSSNKSPYMTDPQLFRLLQKRLFEEHNGITPEISEIIGFQKGNYV